MFIAEIKVVSHGLLAMGGLAAMILGATMLIRTPAPYMQISWAAILISAGATAAFFLFIVGAGVRALQRQPTTGREGLVGELAVVQTRLGPRGQVFVHGELWNAEAALPVEAGGSVKITAVEGLTLRVVPVQGAAAAVPATPGSSG
jgi:membrane-bound serine protease (ClpP class)